MDNLRTSIMFFKKGELQERSVLYAQFPDGDSHCVVEDIMGLKGADILIRHRLYPEQNNQIVKLLLLVDLLQDLNVRSIVLFVPYLPYARQDKRYIPGEAVSANALSRLFARSGITTLYTFDCHFMKGKAETTRCGLKIVNFSFGDELMAYCRKLLGEEPVEVVGPDSGSNYLVQAYGNKNMLKQRGEYESITAGDSYRKVTGLKHEHLQIGAATLIIIDDMISTGGTMVRACEAILKHGAERIYCLASHGLFLNDSYQRLQQKTEAIIVSDSIDHPAAIALSQQGLKQRVLPHWQSQLEHRRA